VFPTNASFLSMLRVEQFGSSLREAISPMENQSDARLRRQLKSHVAQKRSGKPKPSHAKLQLFATPTRVRCMNQIDTLFRLIVLDDRRTRLATFSTEEPQQTLDGIQQMGYNRTN
jgi:hypothetical protein